MIALYTLSNEPYMDTPYHLIGWLGWFVLAASILWLVRQRWSLSSPKRFWFYLVLLTLSTFVVNLFFVLNLPLGESLPLPNMLRESGLTTVLLLSSLPILLAAGYLGTAPAVFIGFIGGIVNGLWNTHSIFTPLEYAALALMISLALRQNFRTSLFKFIRTPLGAVLITILVSIPLLLVTTFFSTNGSLAARLDYAFTQSWPLFISNAIHLSIAGILTSVFSLPRTPGWVRFRTLTYSPIESGLQGRVLFFALPLTISFLLVLAVTDWIVAGRAARDMLENQLKGTATTAVENIPSIFEVGQSLLSSMVEQQMPLQEKNELQSVLKTKIRELPFFTQFFVFDLTGEPITGYPTKSIEQFRLTAEEEAAIELALNGVLIQNYVIPPAPGEDTARVAFVASIPDEYGLSRGVLIGRTSLAINLFTKPTLLSIEALKNGGGSGAILDANNQVLYHTNSSLVMTSYEGQLPESSGYVEDSGTTGERQMLYAAIDPDRGWKVILTMPASYIQDLALRIAIPLLAISFCISILVYLLLHILIKRMTSSLADLAEKADKIAKGELDGQINSFRVDEIGRLSTAFEQMRSSLKSRIDELDMLLKVSRGMTQSFDLSVTSKHLLNALLSYGGDAASLVLIRAGSQEWEDEFTAYRAGQQVDNLAYLDKGVLDLLDGESLLIIPSRTRIKRLGVPSGAPLPNALAAIPIKSNEGINGFFWVAYMQPHRFLEAEVKFLNTLTGQAGLAVANANLYASAEVGKRRLESVLRSTPEPVLVVNSEGGLLLSNQAAEQLSDLVFVGGGSNQERKILSEELISFITLSSGKGDVAEELVLENGHTYLVSLSDVSVDELKGGMVCVLRDITDYKKLEKLKSEYVATVSHDLKNPLGMMRGYTTMIQMVGDLNEQQKTYTSKVIEEIDNIARMADNLLDVGRIDSGVNLQIEKITPSALIDDVIVLLQPQAMNRKVQILKELTLSQELTIEADRALLQRALYNLIDNAVKYSPIGGHVNLRMDSHENDVTFVVQDHGPGIAPLDLRTIFDGYIRPGKGETAGQRATGLGLSIVKSVAERHGGKAWAESNLGKGSTFFLRIPQRQTGNAGKKVKG